MIWSVLGWLSQHPAQVIGLGLFLACGTYIISAAVYALMLASDERQETRQRRELDKIMLASHGKVGAPGLKADHRRVS